MWSARVNFSHRECIQFGIGFATVTALIVGGWYLYFLRPIVSPDLFVASDTRSGDWFGSAVDVYDDTFVISAFRADTTAKNTGSVYVFSRKPNGEVEQIQKISAPEPVMGDEFGFDLVFNDRWLAVSRLAGFQDRSKPRTKGEVLIYQKASSGSLWEYHSRIQEPAASAGNYFGFSLDLSGDLLVVGAAYSLVGEFRPGAAYIVDLQDHDRKVVKLPVPDPQDAEAIGSDVLFVGNRLFVGAPGASFNGVADVGSVYEFSVIDSDNPTLVGILHPINKYAGDRFGTSITSPTGHLVVGASHWAQQKGKEIAWLISLESKTEEATEISLPLRENGNMLGFRASSFGNLLVLSAHFEGVASVPGAGAVHLLEINDGQAVYRGRVTADVPVENDFFGIAIAANRDGVLVGVEKADQKGFGSGAAGFYLYSEFLEPGI